jgi:opacity protein-like surface antigen
MKKASLVALAICLVAGAASAGGTPNTATCTKQLVFQFSGLDDLGLSSYRFGGLGDMLGEFGDYDISDYWYGGGVGLRYFFREGMAVRPSVNISYAKLELPDQSGYTDIEESATRYGFSVVIEKYLPPIHSIAPYIGAGAGYDHFKYEESAKLDNVKLSADVTASCIDLKALAGFQWYFTDGMSLGGEYVGAFTHATSDEMDTTLNSFYWDAASVFLSVEM